MPDRNFREMLKVRWAKGHFVCVGLDSDYPKIPKVAFKDSPVETIFGFNCDIIDAIADLVCAFKLNIAFYEAEGLQGLSALIRTTNYIREKAPEIPIILDAKRGDINGNTNKGYVYAAFQIYRADAITVNPYFGREALQVFLAQADKGIFVLCRTSNPGAGEFQDLQVDGEPLYQIVARQVASEWNENGNCGVVVGATYPEELRKVRGIVGDLPILIPGIGDQGGDIEKTVKAGMDNKKQGMIINSSRRIIFASNGPDFAEAAQKETIRLSDMIDQYRRSEV